MWRLIRPLALLLTVFACTAVQARPASWGRNTEVSLLPAEEAFQLLPVERKGRTVHVEWNIAPGYYLYRQRLQFELVTPGGKLGKVKLPAGKKYHDEHFGDVEIYRGILAADLAVSGKLKGPIRLKLGFQGCADVGVCYPPQTREVEVRSLR